MAKNKSDAAAEQMLDAVAAFLKSQGWNVLVIGSPRIQKTPGERELNYEFVLRFTGRHAQGDVAGREDGR